MDPVEVFVEVRGGVVVDIKSNGRPVKVYLLDWDSDEDVLLGMSGLTTEQLNTRIEEIISKRNWSDMYVENMDFGALL